MAVTCVSDQTDDLKFLATHPSGSSLEPLTEGILTRGILMCEELAGERLVDDGDSGRKVGGEEVSTGNEGNLHGVEPARRDVHEPGRNFRGRSAVDRDGACFETVSVEQWPVGIGDGFDAGHQ